MRGYLVMKREEFENDKLCVEFVLSHIQILMPGTMRIKVNPYSKVYEKTKGEKFIKFHVTSESFPSEIVVEYLNEKNGIIEWEGLTGKKYKYVLSEIIKKRNTLYTISSRGVELIRGDIIGSGEIKYVNHLICEYDYQLLI